MIASGGFAPRFMAGSRGRRLIMPGFHTGMVCAAVVILIISAVGCELTSITVPQAGSLLTSLGISAFVLPALVLYLREKGKANWSDAVLTLFWALFLDVILFFPVAVAARLGAVYPLQDARLIQLDQSIGVNVVHFQVWASNHWLGYALDQSYPLLFPLMKISILLNVLTGKIKFAQDFLASNIIAFAIGLPLFAMFPAIGPWYGFHLPVRLDESICQAALLALRSPGTYTFNPPDGVICFPSFHVVWAILCVQALWGFRWLRFPVSLLAGMIVLSTMSTGVHYFCDVLAGILVAAISVLGSRWLRRSVFVDKRSASLPRTTQTVPEQVTI